MSSVACPMKPSGVDWIGDIPCNWNVMRLKSLALLKTGHTPSSNVSEYFDGDVLWFTPVDIQNSEVENSARSVSQLAVEHGQVSLYAPFSTLLIVIGGTAGKVAYVKQVSSSNQQITALQPINVHAKWLFYATLTQRENLFNLALFTTMPILNNEYLSDYKFAVPPPEEQQAIADYLDEKCAEIDGLVGDIEKQIDILERYKQSVIGEAVTKGLDPTVHMKSSGVDWLGDIPTHWDIRRIDHLYSLRVEKVSERDFPALSVTKQGIVPQLDDVAKTNDVDNRKLVRKNDFVINSRSDRRGSCGISNYDGSVSLINTVLYPSGNGVIGKYYNWLFRTTLFADEFYKWGHGIVDDLWSTAWEDMRKISVCIPPSEEQQAIADFLDKKCAEIDALIATKREQLEKLAECKKSLIYEYVTGKKAVK